ncbi:MAG: hypothetical protein LBS60_07440 [Deltaproteobacteria bacterium]|nr:hypothetical protein [Deltaproteobacteria bacterium]
MPEDYDLPAGATEGPIVSACADRQTREVRIVEGPCPLCGQTQEYFTDELRDKEQVRCHSCKEYFNPALFKPSN